MTDADRPATRELRRPFRLIHAMGLVATTALTLWASPALMKAVMRSYGPVSSWNRGMYLTGTTTLALACWSLVLTPALILANRGRLDAVSRSYGASAAFASASALIVLMVARWLQITTYHVLYSYLRHPWIPNLLSWDRSLQDLWHGLYDSIPKAVAVSVVAAWSTLAATRIGRRPSDWLEVAGLLLGLAWIAWPMGGGQVVVRLLKLLTGDQDPSW